MDPVPAPLLSLLCLLGRAEREVGLHFSAARIHGDLHSLEAKLQPVVVGKT